jgi:class 3 adenylate cyclase
MPRHANDAFILAHADAKLDDSALKVPPGVGRKAEEHETPAHGGNRECSCKVLKLSGQRQGRGRAVRRDRWTTPPRLPLQRKAEVCEGTAHKNAQPTHPGWNAQPPDLYLLSKDDPQQMHYRHDEKQRGGDRHISFSVQSACLSTSRPTTPDSSLRLRVARCLAAFWHGRARFDGHQDRSCRSFVAHGLTRQAVWIATGLPCLMSRSARLGAVDRLPSEAHTKGRPVVGRLEFSTRRSREEALSGERVERRLAAILAADVVAYSRLMGQDEAGTLARLRTHRRELINPEITEHKGRIVKTTGDGILIEFPSVVEAVACAVAVQRGMVDRNAGTPEKQQIVFRVGINLGDIIIAEDNDIHGDGVNVAARLEGIAEPGGICVAAIVHDQVRDKLDLVFDDMGDQAVKNIARPVRVYRVRLATAETAPSASPVKTTPTLPLPDKPSIAVLPFQNMSGDPEQEYFADGMVEEIITALSRIRWLFVIARNSSFTYKGKRLT